jgi:hypothetical protein
MFTFTVFFAAMDIIVSQANSVTKEFGPSKEEAMEEEELSSRDIRGFSDGSSAVTEDSPIADADIKEVDRQSVVETSKKLDDGDANSNGGRGASGVELPINGADDRSSESMVSNENPLPSKECDTKVGDVV